MPTPITQEQYDAAAQAWDSRPHSTSPMTGYHDTHQTSTPSGSTGSYHPYVGSHPYDDGYVRPSQADLDAEAARRGGGSFSVSGEEEVPWIDQIESHPEIVQSLYGGEAAAQAGKDLLASTGLDQGPAKVDRIEHIDTEAEEQMLGQLTEAQRQQAEMQVAHAVQTGTVGLQRAMQDAQGQYQQARNQIDVEEQRARDNQALYSEARGDRGGIGQAQYDSIQNTAATNRLTVQNEQTKLATDTARQIADLRAQGEFEKANQLLSITQNYLSQLMSLYTWAKETNLGIDQFNVQVSQWEENYKLSLLGADLDIASATGVFGDGTPTYATWAKTQELLAASGQALLEKGIAPTSEQLAAMGMTPEQAEQYANDPLNIMGAAGRYGGNGATFRYSKG